MRILFVNPYWKPYLGGIERIVDRVAAGLLAHPAVEAVGMLTTRVNHPERREWPDLPAEEVLDGVHVYRCTFRPSNLPRVIAADMAGYLSRDAVRAVRRFRPTVVHFTNVIWWPANLQIFALTPRRPHVVSTFYHPVPRSKGSVPVRAATRALTRWATAVHTLSRQEITDVRAAYGTPRERFVHIPPGVDLPPSPPDRSGRGAVTILSVGRLQPEKGQDRLVRALARLRDLVPGTDVRLVLAGPDSGLGPEIRSLAGELGVAQRVTLAGRVSDQDLADLYRAADIFALPSRYESFGLVFTEAMGHGLPVVADAVGPMRSIFDRGAILAEPLDDGALASALAELVADAGRRARLSLEARAFAEAQPSWSEVTGRFVEVYRGAGPASAPPGD